MKLQKIKTDDYMARVCCSGCNKPVHLFQAYADLDGAAFQSYYHPQCIPEDESTKTYEVTFAINSNLDKTFTYTDTGMIPDQAVEKILRAKFNFNDRFLYKPVNIKEV